MPCAACVAKGCRGDSRTHHDQGCNVCKCGVLLMTLTGETQNPKVGPGLKKFDRWRRQRPKLNWLQRKFAKNKRLADVFDEFGIIYLTITSAAVTLAAGFVATIPGAPFWVIAFLGLGYAPYFSYQAVKFSESKMHRKFQEKIDDLNKRIDELQGK